MPEQAALLKDLPPEAKAFLTLQMKPKWTRADHAYARTITRSWSQVHRQVFEDRFARLLGRPIRWA